ncbi:MAG: AraC family transcriptional regulator [Marinomonas sp.]
MNSVYLARIQQALQYIETNLNTNLSLSDVAKASYFSEFHFHRIFKGVMDETLNDYIGRRRMEKAANKLVCHQDLSITQIAHESGFSSSANFAKAVKLYFGFSPSQLRNPTKIHAKESKIGKIQSKYGKVFSPSDLYPTHITISDMTSAPNGAELGKNQLKMGNKMDVKVKKLSEQKVWKLSSVEGYEESAIYQTWGQLIDFAQTRGVDEKAQQRFAFCYDNPVLTPLNKCRYEAAIIMPEETQNTTVSAPYFMASIPAGKYAVHYYKGPGADAVQAHLRFYSDWLPQSGYEPDHFPIMEHYLNDARVDGFVEMEIYIKLKAL